MFCFFFIYYLQDRTGIRRDWEFAILPTEGDSATDAMSFVSRLTSIALGKINSTLKKKVVSLYFFLH